MTFLKESQRIAVIFSFLVWSYQPGFQSSKLQSRIRCVLIMALQHLDLTDDYTWKCLESALTYIQGLLDQVDLTVFPSTSATRQWFQLGSLINLSDDMEGQQHETETSSARRCKHLPFVDSAEISAGAYYPNKKIKGRIYRKHCSKSFCPC